MLKDKLHHYMLLHKSFKIVGAQTACTILIHSLASKKANPVITCVFKYKVQVLILQPYVFKHLVYEGELCYFELAL